MKTSTLLIAAGAVGVFVMLAKSRKPGIGDADMLLPPTGRTVTASGQVLGGLGLLTTYQDAYDASPSQYNRAPRNDFVPGFGAQVSDYSVAVYEGMPAGHDVDDHLIQGDYVYKVRPGYEGAKFWSLDTTATSALRAKNEEARREAQRLENQILAQKAVNETIAAIQKKAEEEMAAQAKAEQDRQAAAAKAEQDRQAAAAKAEQDRQAKVEQPVVMLSRPIDPSTYGQTKQAYDAVAAAREQASMSQASSDTGYGRTSDDTGYGATQQVTEEGAPKLPERVSSVRTPSAVMQRQFPAPAAPSGDSKVGLLVGGGVLAAIAAAMAV